MIRRLISIWNDPPRRALAGWSLVTAVLYIADMLGLLDRLPVVRDRLPALAVLLVAGVALYLVSDSVSAQQRQDEISSDLQALSSSINSIKLKSAEEVYRIADFLVCGADSRIRATSFGDGGDRVEAYLDRIAELAGKREEDGRDFQYKVVLPNASACELKLNGDTPDYLDKAVKRQSAFSKHKVSKCLHTYLLKISPSWGIDLLIIDRHSALITFLQGSRIRSGVAFINNTAVVGPIADWYDDYMCNRLGTRLTEELRA